MSNDLPGEAFADACASLQPRQPLKPRVAI